MDVDSPFEAYRFFFKLKHSKLVKLSKIVKSFFSKLNVGMEEPILTFKRRLHVSDYTGLNTTNTCVPKIKKKIKVITLLLLEKEIKYDSNYILIFMTLKRTRNKMLVCLLMIQSMSTVQ